jgi:capping protein beta
MPPGSVETSLSGLINLVPELTDELLQRVDQPLKTEKDPKSGKTFILCDYNRDGDSYRSPWSNEYFPPLDDGFVPSEEVRKIEMICNEVFDRYRHLYYEGGHSSVYCWDLDDGNFAACWLVRKDVENVRGLAEGAWNSIHVIECAAQPADKWEYKLTTTVIVSMKVDNEDVGLVDLSGSMTKQDQRVLTLNDDNTHVSNMGKMIEDIELVIRNTIEGIYIQKTREVINGMRSANGPKNAQFKALIGELTGAVTSRGASSP